jgi:hypothetical protein
VRNVSRILSAADAEAGKMLRWPLWEHAMWRPALSALPTALASLPQHNARPRSKEVIEAGPNRCLAPLLERP